MAPFLSVSFRAARAGLQQSEELGSLLRPCGPANRGAGGQGPHGGFGGSAPTAASVAARAPAKGLGHSSPHGSDRGSGEHYSTCSPLTAPGVVAASWRSSLWLNLPLLFMTNAFEGHI